MHDARIRDPFGIRTVRPVQPQTREFEGKNWRLTLASIVAAAGIVATTSLLSPLITGAGHSADDCADQPAAVCASHGSGR
jgi:hypothetical protein